MLDCQQVGEAGAASLPHPAVCPFCDQHQECLHHILLRCVLAREVRTVILGYWGKQDWIPTMDNDLVDCWASKEDAGGFTSDI